jgi:hypothetical protein
MIIHKLEDCPRAKQDLQKMVNRMRFRQLLNKRFKKVWKNGQ